MHASDAKNEIEVERPDLKIHVLPEVFSLYIFLLVQVSSSYLSDLQGAMVTSDYRMDRVRIFVDKEGKVARTPRIG